MSTKLATETHKAWAISAVLGSQRLLLGHGWFGWPQESHLRGMTIALFPTRASARAALPAGRLDCRVERVIITIRIRGYGRDPR